MATWVPTNARIGMQPVTTSSTTQLHSLGTVMKAYDNTTSGQGEGEFIYLLGVANTVVGSLVTYSKSTFQTSIAINTANQAAPVAVSMSANVAAAYGWYQIGGNAVIKKTAVVISASKPVYLASSTVTGNGRIFRTASVTALAGRQILGARSANLASVTTTTSTVMVTIDRPNLQGQIT